MLGSFFYFHIHAFACSSSNEIFLSLFSSKPTSGSLLYLDSMAYRPLAIYEL
nr:MAG TPA: hypothetical protein [Caudoviricetes sp.]